MHAKRLRIVAALAVSFTMIAPALAGENVARGKSYALAPAPDYTHCTDPDDRTQLTDGVLVEGYFWTQRGTVGWSGASPVTVTIDLGSVEPIDGISYRTAAGVAGVEWPRAIYILASDDGKAYHLAGDLVAMSARASPPPREGYAVHVFRCEGLATRGRFVRLLIAASPYTFVDEIEVLRGTAAAAERPILGRRIEDTARFFAEERIVMGLRRRLEADAAAVASALERAPLAELERRMLRTELERIAREIADVQVQSPETFSTAFPVNDLHRRIFAVQGALWRASGRAGLAVWQSPPWDMLSPTEPPRDGGAAIDIEMMRNEFRSAAFNISNCSDRAVEARIAFAGIPGNPAPSWLAVHEVAFTDTLSGVPVAAALPLAPRPAGGAASVTIPAGMTRQVWLTAHSRDVPPGDHRGSIAIEGVAASVPLRVKIFPISFPDRPTLHLGGWDYTDRERCYEATPENRAAFIRHMRERFVDTPWAQSAVMPPGTYDAQGAMVEPPSSAEFEEWLRRWPNARNYYVFAAVGSSFAGHALGTPAFTKAVGAWITWWVERLRSLGVRPGQLGLLLVDEPRARDQDRIVIEYARAIRAAQPEVVIWEDPIWDDPRQATPELFEVCHILCPNLPMWLDHGKAFADFYGAQRAAGRRLWLYSCSGPGKLLDPYAYHRLQHWFCWKHGAEGSGFWAFGDGNGASPWNEYASRVGAYTPFFLDATTVTAGKHGEAIREGIEDYEYLRMLRDRIEALAARGAKPEALEPARRLLAEGPDRVLAPMTSSGAGLWRQPKDRSVADRVRREILACLAALEGAD